MQRHPSPLSGSIWFFNVFFSILSLIFFLITVFTNIFFLSYHCFTYIFLFTVLLELIFFHVSAFSWLFLISLCRSFHIFSSVLFFVLFSCPPNRNSPRTWSVQTLFKRCLHAEVKGCNWHVTEKCFKKSFFTSETKYFLKLILDNDLRF